MNWKKTSEELPICSEVNWLGGKTTLPLECLCIINCTGVGLYADVIKYYDSGRWERNLVPDYWCYIVYPDE
jgi:hypothetical protein